MREDVIEMASDVLDIYNDIITACEQNPKMWETVAKDCLAEVDYDDIEDIAKERGWKLPLDSYLYHADQARGDFVKMCEQNPKMWEDFVKSCLKRFPSDFVEYLFEERDWLSVGDAE